jgi:hypothetical protein
MAYNSYSLDYKIEALDLVDKTSIKIATHKLSIPRGTIRGWIKDREKLLQESLFSPKCPKCHSSHDHPSSLPIEDYAYILGIYLGDGCISPHAKGVYRIRITLDNAYSMIIKRVRNSLQNLYPSNRVSVVPHSVDSCSYVSCYSKNLICYFPQHGPGKKHQREIFLTEWQQTIVDASPAEFLRGLYHSDGCRSHRIDKRYNTSNLVYKVDNLSQDILDLVKSTCEKMELHYTQPSKGNYVAVSRQRDTQQLESILGIKT